MPSEGIRSASSLKPDSPMEERTRRIAKNTLALYFRTFLTMAIGLYTGRVQLEALGIDNYGINAVVGGIIAFSGLITATMSAASSRYITFALGEGNMEKMRKVFATVSNVQIIFALLAIVFLEIAGVWFLNTTADIPDGRLTAANWVLQNSILTTALGIVMVPYNASIIAHERMTLYAYMSIVDALVKLAICFVIIHYGGDRLILCSTLWTISAFLMMIFYIIYCRTNFPEARYALSIDRPLLRHMASYSGWNFLSNTSWMFNTQGVNMLINVFFGVAFNAAKGVANTVNAAAHGFVSNFTAAFSPQITKSYAAGDYDYCYKLVNRGTKFTWYLMLLFMVPICFEADTLLSLWLVEVPPMAVLFLRLTMIESLALKYNENLLRLIQVNGEMKHYTIAVTLFSVIVFPIVWLAYWLGAPVWISYPIFSALYASLTYFRFRTLRRLTTYDPATFIRDAMVPCLKVTVLSLILPTIIMLIMPEPSLTRFCIMVPTSVANIAAIVYLFGLTTGERLTVRNIIFSRLGKARTLFRLKNA